MGLKQFEGRLAVLLSLAVLWLAACEPATPGSPAYSEMPVPATTVSLPAITQSPPTARATVDHQPPTASMQIPSETPSSTPPPTPTGKAQAVEIQADPPQAEPGQPITVRVTGLPPAVLTGEQTACVNLEDAQGHVREGLLPLAPDEAGAASARLEPSNLLKPGDYQLNVVICGWTAPTDGTPPPAEPPVLASLPYTVLAPSGQFDRVQRILSPDGRWTAILNETKTRLDLRREVDGETLPIFPEGSTANAVVWSPDSRRLLAVRANWQIAQPGKEIQASGPIEIWEVSLQEGQGGQPERLFQAPAEGPAPGQIVFGQWSPDSRYVLFWLGPLSASIQADGLPLYLLDTQTGQAIPTGEVTLLNAAYQSWAPDSSALAFTAGGYRSAQVNKWLDLFEIASGQITTVISMTQQIPGIVAWSPRGDTIAYAAVPADQTGDEWADWMVFDNPAIAGRRVYLLDPATGQYKGLNDADTFQDAPAWSEDGKTLYYVQREEDTLVLMAADPYTGEAEPIEASRRPAPRAVGYYGQSDWTDLLGYRPDAPRAEVPPLAETYTDPEGSFSLRYPAGWHIGDGWQSITGWQAMPTLSSYPPDGPPPDLGPFSGQALIALQVIPASAGSVQALLEEALASPGPDQTLDQGAVLTAFDQRQLTIDGREGLRLETMGTFGTVNHMLVVLDGTQAYVLRCRGDGRVFDVVIGSLRLGQRGQSLHIPPAGPPYTDQRSSKALESAAASPTATFSQAEAKTTVPPIADYPRAVAITWRRTDESGQCLQARMGREWLEAGQCDQAPAIYPLGERRQAELAQFLGTFTTFQTDTKAGRIAFSGTQRSLNQVPFPAEERMLATWAWGVSQEAISGRVPAWDLALEWNPEEGGRCEKLRIYLTGFAEAFACDGGELAELGRERLGPGDLAQLYDWYDRFQPTRTERFELLGSGLEQPDEAGQGAVERYAQGLYAVLAALAPGAAGTPVEPFAAAAYIRFEGWSPDSRWLAYWLSSQEDVDHQLPGAMPGGTLHFADVATGQTCAAPQFHSETDQAACVDWVVDGRVVVVMGGQAFQGAPCQSKPFAALADYAPAGEAPPGPALSPDGRQRAATALVSSANGVLTFQTILTDTVEMRPVQSVRWQIDERLGDYGLGGQWVSRTQFLIYETLDKGPLLVDVQRGTIPVLTDLFGMNAIPSILGEEAYSLHATAAPSVEPDMFHLAISGVGSEGNFPPVRLYHAESELVETLPYQKVWGFSAKYKWLFLYEGVDQAGHEIGYNLWARRLEDTGGAWRLLAPAFDYLLWQTDESEMAFTQNETSVVWQTFPAGEPLGRWHTDRYWVLPLAFSPDGRYLALVGNQPGLWQYGLFVLERLEGSP